MKTKAKSKILKAMHQTVTGMYKAGGISKETLREFDALCLAPVHELSPKAIKKIRLDARVSQAVLAAYMNTSTSTIQKWEIGEKNPSGIALKMLNLVKNKGLEVLI